MRIGDPLHPYTCSFQGSYFEGDRSMTSFTGGVSQTTRKLFRVDSEYLEWAREVTKYSPRSFRQDNVFYGKRIPITSIQLIGRQEAAEIALTSSTKYKESNIEVITVNAKTSFDDVKKLIDALQIPLTPGNNKVVMIDPGGDARNNLETALTNPHQKEDSQTIPLDVQKQEAAFIQEEFDSAVQLLRENGIEVIVVKVPKDENLNTDFQLPPDLIFPDWFMLLPEGKLLICNPVSGLRRLEETVALNPLVENLTREGYKINEIINCMHWNEPIEGKGSFVIDWYFPKERINPKEKRPVYVCKSDRSGFRAAATLAEKFDLELITFEAYEGEPKNSQKIYHTDVILALGPDFALLCPEAIPADDLKNLEKSLSRSGRIILHITREQLNAGAGNISVLGNNVFIPKAAWDSLSEAQQLVLSRNGQRNIVTPELEYIWKVGGGGMNCISAANLLGMSL